MTEKRSDYRKRQKKNLLNKVKSAFTDDDSSEDVNVNPDFLRNDSEGNNRRRPLEGNGQEFNPQEQSGNKEIVREEKSLKLKKRLNSAILVVFVLIILVLLALFHL